MITKKIIIKIIILVILGGGLYFVFSLTHLSPSSDPLSEKTTSMSGEPLSSFTPLEKKYSNSKYKFSLKIPEDFKIREIALDGSDLILFENKKGEGIQVMISPFDDIRVLTTNMIKNELPDFKIIDPQSIDIEKGYKGLVFKSDNPDFGGISQEIWFIFRNNLYQISTYERLGPLLREIFTAWNFE